jgi:hypothetical protein
VERPFDSFSFDVDPVNRPLGVDEVGERRLVDSMRDELVRLDGMSVTDRLSATGDVWGREQVLREVLRVLEDGLGLVPGVRLIVEKVADLRLTDRYGRPWPGAVADGARLCAHVDVGYLGHVAVGLAEDVRMLDERWDE